MDVFAFRQCPIAVHSKCLLGGQGSAGTRPEHRCKSGMDGGFTAAILINPPLYLRTLDFLSKRWGPPHSAGRKTHCRESRLWRSLRSTYPSAARAPSAFPSPCRKDAHNISNVTCFEQNNHYYHGLLDLYRSQSKTRQSW